MDFGIYWLMYCNVACFVAIILFLMRIEGSGDAKRNYIKFPPDHRENSVELLIDEILQTR
jgi:hypothetical protein